MTDNQENIQDTNLYLGWLLVIGCSLAALLGASIVYLDLILQKYFKFSNINLLDNPNLLSTFIFLASGFLFYSSQFILIPEAYEQLSESEKFKQYPLIFLTIFYLSGVFLAYLVTFFIGYFLPSAIHTCGDDNPNSNHTHSHIEDYAMVEERDGFLALEQDYHLEDAGELAETTNTSVIPNLTVTISPDSNEINIGSLNNSKRELLKVGLQTAVAITLHKFPEGLITISSSIDKSQLSLSLGLSIMLHNIPEGSMLALPILASTNSRKYAFLVGALVGGLTQPIGAIVATLVYSKSDSFRTLNQILFPIVAGIMATVVIQTLTPVFIGVSSFVHRVIKFKIQLFAFGFGFFAMALAASTLPSV